jgi:hypothetical protein
MSAVTASSRWEAVGQLVELNARDQFSRRYGVLAEAISWFKAVDLFRQAELAEMVLREPGRQDLRRHRACLAQVIAEGERLAMLAESDGLPANPEGITCEDIDAQLEALYDTLMGWHGGITQERRQQVMAEVFGLPQSSN